MNKETFVESFEADDLHTMRMAVGKWLSENHSVTVMDIKYQVATELAQREHGDYVGKLWYSALVIYHS